MDKVLILDDDSFAQSLLHKSLYQHYEVRATGDGSQASIWEPNVILLDMEITGKNGCEIFEELKHQKETHDIDGSSLPSHSSARQRMPGLEVGGNDFLVKPCSPEVLRRKLAKLPKYQQQKQSFKKSINTVEKKLYKP